MTTFSGQSCVLGTAESCGDRRDECGALGFVDTRMGQEMGSMLLLRFFGLACRSGGVMGGKRSAPHWFAQRVILRAPAACVDAVGCQTLPTPKKFASDSKTLAICCLGN